MYQDLPGRWVRRLRKKYEQRLQGGNCKWSFFSATGQGIWVSVQWVWVGEMESVCKGKAKKSGRNQTWALRVSEAPLRDSQPAYDIRSVLYKGLSGRSSPYGFEIGCKEMRTWTKAMAIEMEKKEEIWDGQEAGSIALKHRKRGSGRRGHFWCKWGDEVIAYWMGKC